MQHRMEDIFDHRRFQFFMLQKDHFWENRERNHRGEKTHFKRKESMPMAHASLPMMRIFSIGNIGEENVRNACELSEKSFFE